MLGFLLKVRHGVGIASDGTPTRLKHRKKRRHAIGEGAQCWISAPFQQMEHEIEASVQSCDQQGAGCVGCRDLVDVRTPIQERHRHAYVPLASRVQERSHTARSPHKEFPDPNPRCPPL